MLTTRGRILRVFGIFFVAVPPACKTTYYTANHVAEYRHYRAERRTANASTSHRQSCMQRTVIASLCGCRIAILVTESHGLERK